MKCLVAAAAWLVIFFKTVSFRPPAHFFKFTLLQPDIYVISLKIFPPLPGWRRSKRRRSSSGKGQNWRLRRAWLCWVPSLSPPTCWRRRRMKTCCLSEAFNGSRRFHPSSYLFCASQATSMSSHASDESCFVCTCLWWFVLLFQCWKALCVCRSLSVWSQRVVTLGCYPQRSQLI